ncbi:MAG: hypothetical protein A3F72_19265 [Bacteroidetes bacterium RIFCSPLOWO2_12_FULL_35_15]|nr:MAG: hypothetical protein A3F72_19265 [Bacteroidetes bacterium RIFCSPLOWO2_12_FULL_35_15]
MKNALDEIICIPTLGGKKPPYQIISHPYCVDIITAYIELSKLDFINKEYYLKMIEDNVKFYCLSNKIDFNYHFENKLPLIIPPTANNFQWFLGHQIIGFDINKIKALLSFQQKRYQNEETDFITFVEFPVYNTVKYFTQVHNTKRLRTIMEWVNEQRSLSTIFCKAHTESNNDSTNNKKTKEDSSINQKTKKTPPKKPKIILPSYTLLGYKINPQYFEKNAVNFAAAFYLLKGGGFIHSETNKDCFKNILKGEEIKRENRIEWTGKIKDLNRFIKFLIDENKIKNFVNKWETSCKCFINSSGYLSAGQLRTANGKNDNEAKLKDIVKLL